MEAKDKGSDKKYNRLKEFRGSKYSGMKVGASHKWYYDQGEWKERKITQKNGIFIMKQRKKEPERHPLDLELP